MGRGCDHGDEAALDESQLWWVTVEPWMDQMAGKRGSDWA
jgi:hypothetical protein